MTFTPDALARIAQVLGVEAESEGSLVRFSVRHQTSGRRLALEITPRVDVAGVAMALVSVYGSNSFLQLQGCTGFVASEELGEVIFFARNGGATSGLVVEREAGCSLYANVEEALLQADFTQLPPPVMMSAVALSMTEPLFEA